MASSCHPCVVAPEVGAWVTILGQSSGANTLGRPSLRTQAPAVHWHRAAAASHPALQAKAHVPAHWHPMGPQGVDPTHMSSRLYVFLHAEVRVEH